MDKVYRQTVDEATIVDNFGSAEVVLEKLWRLQVKLESMIQEILCEVRTMLEISWQAYSEFFQHTWLASHLRLVVITPDEELSLATQLYFVDTFVA